MYMIYIKLMNAALKDWSMETQYSLESRVATLEADVRHIQSDVTEIKAHIQRLDAKMERLNDKVDAVRDSIATAKIWALLLYFAQSAALLGVMAHGFGWLK